MGSSPLLHKLRTNRIAQKPTFGGEAQVVVVKFHQWRNVLQQAIELAAVDRTRQFLLSLMIEMTFEYLS